MRFEYLTPGSPGCIEAITGLHQHAFRNVLSGQIGGAFVRFYYCRLLENPQAVICVCRLEGKIVGFLAGLADTGDFYDVTYYQKALAGLFGNLLQCSSASLNVLRYLKRALTFNDRGFRAELLAMAVSGEHQRKGIGKRLIGMFEDFLRSKDRSEYKVFTDTKFSAGSDLYEAMGFRLCQQADLFGLPMRMYVRRMK